MRDVLHAISGWYDSGERFALGTVVHTSRSAPRGPGAAMAVSGAGEVVGSVSGGCVEGAVYEAAQLAVQTGEPALEKYGVSDDEAFAVGLTCGGIIHVFVEPVDRTRFPQFGEVVASIERSEPVAVATVVDGHGRIGARRVLWPDHASGSLGDERLDHAVTEDARAMLAQAQTGIRHYGLHGERRHDEVSVFVQSYTPAPRMLVFGAIDFASAVARIGVFLCYHVTVCDARPVFATRRRFPEAHEVVCEWPHRYLARTAVDERTVICVLTHDPKFDVPLLQVALGTRAAYIGVMGSRRTHRDRIDRLREQGVTDDELQRLASPIGLDIGSHTPEETAISIAAEIIQTRTGGTGERLSRTDGPIHRASARPTASLAEADLRE
ncbi:XdhC family protein [Streptomyces thermocarboxydovorans]|uniref:XdhC family protein n=1 Tax=Streptomyces thermocarboxydovorans TaxID=59298 RepID=A0ABP3SXW2_9ACTN